jgi:hypothetical protein
MGRPRKVLEVASAMSQDEGPVHDAQVPARLPAAIRLQGARAGQRLGRSPHGRTGKRQRRGPAERTPGRPAQLLHAARCMTHRPGFGTGRAAWKLHGISGSVVGRVHSDHPASGDGDASRTGFEAAFFAELISDITMPTKVDGNPISAAYRLRMQTRF